MGCVIQDSVFHFQQRQIYFSPQQHPDRHWNIFKLMCPSWWARRPDELTAHIHVVPRLMCVSKSLLQHNSSRHGALKRHKKYFISLFSTLVSLRKSNDWKLRREKERYFNLLTIRHESICSTSFSIRCS
jgi:hypothetical protein